MWQQTKNLYHLCIAILANVHSGFPSKKLIVIGVTGTDGKTTTVNLIYHILNNAGLPVSVISTINAIIHGESYDTGFHVTSPSALAIQKFIRRALVPGISKNYLVLEVTSHALDQHRAWGIPFTVGIITNITHEHLDYHKTYEKYVAAKVKLLKKAKIVILNRDDASYELIIKKIKQTPSQKVITYGIHTKADIMSQTLSYTTSLPGEFNQYNILAAISACRALGIQQKKIIDGIATFQSPVGRMQEVANNKGISIYIDFAHTPNALEKALKTIDHSRGKKEGRIISLIGAEGYRDKEKRAKMGEIATRLSDIVIITAVDPRGLIEEINRQILEGVKKADGEIGKNIFIENDREKAINFAINEIARKGDSIGIFGKGHEQSHNFTGKKEESWSDYEAVQKSLHIES